MIVYVHSHSGNRLEGLNLLDDLLPDVNLCVFDCSGSGLSDGEYTTLGLKEAEDLKSVIIYLKNHYNVGEIGLWGRSMGAVTCLLYDAKLREDIEVSCMVLDSPFTDIRVLIGDTMKAMKNIPKWVTATALLAISGTIMKKTGKDVLSLKPIKYVKNILTPALFIVAREDVITPECEVRKMYKKYKSEEKQFYLIDGEHHSSREWEEIEYGIEFMKKHINKVIVNKRKSLASGIQLGQDFRIN